MRWFTIRYDQPRVFKVMLFVFHLTPVGRPDYSRHSSKIFILSGSLNRTVPADDCHVTRRIRDVTRLPEIHHKLALICMCPDNDLSLAGMCLCAAEQRDLVIARRLLK